MKNKLLMSTALVGSMFAADFAMAQTTVSGNLALNYRTQEKKTATTGNLNSTRGFGRETQVNIQNKGKLNNGMDYAAGFSLEFDGQDRDTRGAGLQAMAGNFEPNSISNENIYINFISGNTTLHVGVDHIQNITTDVVPMVLPLMDNVAAGFTAAATNTVGANPKEAMGFGLIQAIPGAGLTASVLYVPVNGDFGNGDHNPPSDCQTAASSSGTVAVQSRLTGCRNSAYEVGVVGRDTFGVKGLGLRAFTNKEKAHTTGVPDLRGNHYGISYTTGAIGVGIERYFQNRVGTTSDQDLDQKSIQLGATYAATKEISLGLVHARTDLATALSRKEKITSAQVGYNLGPVGVAFAISKIDNIGATTATGVDGKEAQIRLTTAF